MALAFLLSFCLHVTFGTMVFLVAPIFAKKERLPEIYTVRLFYPEEKREEKRTPSLQKEKTKKNSKKIPKRQELRPKKKTAKKKKIPKKISSPKKTKVSQKEKVISTRPKRPKKESKAKQKESKAKQRPEKNEDELLRGRVARIREKVREKEQEAYLKKRLQEIKEKTEESIPVSVAGEASQQGGDLRHKRYFLRVWAMIREKWVLPQELLDRTDLVAVVVIRVYPSGAIKDWEFEKRSGVAIFDQSVKRTMLSVASLPPPPKDFLQGGARGIAEIGVRFRPEE